MSESRPIYELSDEELMELGPESIERMAAQYDEPEEETQAPEESEMSEVEEPAEDSPSGEDDKAGDETLETADEYDNEDEQEDSPEAAPGADPEEVTEEVLATAPADQPDTTDSPVETTTEEPDYKAVYDRIFAPFKANGREMKIDSVDDAVALMQMGANYNKKMAALKPNLKVLKLLEKNNLLSEEKLSFLIDLDKRNPEAIKKLVKESGIDPLDMDLSEDSEYKPTTYTVDERELALDEVLDEIQDTPTYTKVIDLVSNKWDGPSKQIVANNPQLLKVINGHMASGIYDVISNEVEKERMLGRLSGLSDIEAYRIIGDSLNERGAFNHLVQQAPPAPATTPRQVVQPKPKAKDAKLNDKRRAASPAPAGTPVTKADAVNPLALSDEEFGKLVDQRFL